MCTVTYLPLASQGFVLTSSRDESVARKPALPPARYHLGGHYVFYPKDQEAGGTWIATSTHQTICLLNGAFSKHLKKASYRKSRGLVFLDFFLFASTADYLSTYDFTDIEPFTMIIIGTRPALELQEVRWDGDMLHVRVLDGEVPHIWSSATLYDKYAIEEREHWFEEWLSQEAISPGSMLTFHGSAGKGDDYNGVVMDRKVIKTVSITSVVCAHNGCTMFYQDRQNQLTKEYRIY